MSVELAADLAFRGRFEIALTEARSFGRSRDTSWIEGYVDAARGNFVRAERTLRDVLSASDPRDATRARAAATLGSVLRQTARHAEARRIERAALGLAPSAGLRTHLSIGLAADAVGLGDLRAVDAALARVGSRPAGGWRAVVRLRWVRCERDLLAGRPAAAATHARRALTVAERASARRHEAKSLLFMGAALAEAAGSDGRTGRWAAERAREADRALRRARTLALRVGARPIADVADELLGRGGVAPSARR